MFWSRDFCKYGRDSKKLKQPSITNLAKIQTQES